MLVDQGVEFGKGTCKWWIYFSQLTTPSSAIPAPTHSYSVFKTALSALYRKPSLLLWLGQAPRCPHCTNGR